MPTEPIGMKGSSAGGPPPLQCCSWSQPQPCVLRKKVYRGVSQPSLNAARGPQAASSRAS